MSRLALLAFGVFAYFCFLASIAAGIDFVAGAGILRGLDGPSSVPVPAAIAIDVALLALFGVSHNVMARPGFKRRWPGGADRRRAQRLRARREPVPRADVWQWRALPDADLEHDRRGPEGGDLGDRGGGRRARIWSSFLTSHVDLFGLRQVWLAAHGALHAGAVKERVLYRWVSHRLDARLLPRSGRAPTMTWGPRAVSRRG
jgi:hypothetical protein